MRFKADRAEKRQHFEPANPAEEKPREIGKHNGGKGCSQSIGELHVLHLGKDAGSNQGDGCGDWDAESFRKHPEEEKDVTVVNHILNILMHW
jgi:hypothetical protein